MILTDEKAKLFYDLWIPLLDYVNKKHHLVKVLYGMTSPKGLPLMDVIKISEKLWENVSVIDEYLESVSEKMPAEHREIVAGWKKAVHGRFIVDRHLKRGTVLVFMEDNRVFVVCGIYSSLQEILEGFPIPQVVQTTLIPFENTIIYDGIVQPLGISLGKNMADEVKQIYKKAKETGNLIDFL